MPRSSASTRRRGSSSPTKNRRIFFDAVVVILGTSGDAACRRLLTHRGVDAVSSTLLRVEVLAPPRRWGDRPALAAREAVFARSSCVPVSSAILRAAEALVGEVDIDTVDAVHVATAAANDAWFVTLDHKVLGARAPVPILTPEAALRRLGAS